MYFVITTITFCVQHCVWEELSLLGFVLCVCFSLEPKAVKAVVFVPWFTSGSQGGPGDVVKSKHFFFRKCVYLCTKGSLLTGNPKGFLSSLPDSQG